MTGRWRARGLFLSLLALFCFLATCAWGLWWWRQTLPLRRAEALYANGQYRLALDAGFDILKYDPQNQRAARVVALCIAQSDNPRAANDYFETAAPVLTRDDWHLRAHTLMSIGDVAGAASAFDQMLQRWPQDPAALRNLAVLSFQRDETKRAIEVAQQLTSVPGQEAVGFALLGTFHRRLTLASETVRYHLEALRLDPELKTIPEPVQFLKDLAESLYEVGRPKDAEPYLLRALEMKREAETLVVLGRLRREQGDVDGAREFWKEALTLRSNSADALAELGTLALWEGKVSEAIELLEKSLDIDGTHVEANYQLGMAYQRINKLEQAKKHFAVAQKYRRKEVERLIGRTKNAD